MKHTLTLYEDNKKVVISFKSAEETLIFGSLVGKNVIKVYNTETYFAWLKLFRGVRK